MKFFKSQKGQSLIELLIVIGLAAVLMPALLTGFVASRSGRAQQDQRLLATGYLREGQEAARAVRENDWINFSKNGTYFPKIVGSSWTFGNGQEAIVGTNGITRQIVISDVCRDATGIIVSCGSPGSSIDSSTKKADTTVSWGNPIPASITATEYLTRYANLVFSASGNADPPGGGHGDWCKPNLLAAPTLDLPKNGVANAITAIEGRAFAGTGNNSSGVSFANVSITNPPWPASPAASIIGTYNGFKTNGVFGEANYGYLATDTNSKEIVIVNLTTSPYSEAGYFDAPGNGSGNSVFVSGNIGYMTSGSILYTFDLSSKSGSRPKLGSVSLSGTGNKVFVVGNYAYVAESGSTQLQIIQVSPNGKTLSIVGQAQVSGSNGIDVSLNLAATRAYLATAGSSSQKELFVIDISTKTGNRTIIYSYEANGMSPKGVRIVPSPESRIILVGTSGEEYQAIKIKDDSGNEILPILCKGVNIDSGVNGVASVLEADGDAYSYIITGDTSTEFKIIEGGIGTGGNGNGVFESSTFDANHNVAFNYFSGTVDPSLSYKIAIKQAVSGVCPSSFLDPDFTTVNPNPGSLALPGVSYSNPGQCLRYRVINSGLVSKAYIVNINYSP